MADWLEAGRRIKADWVAMLAGMRGRSAEKVKLPFVPLRVSGVALRRVLRDILPAILGKDPGLLTAVREEGRVVRAYAEDASSGVYEELRKLDAPPEARDEELRALAREAGADVGVLKEADVRFFKLFAHRPGEPDESDELLAALSLLAGGVARALREGWLRFDPPLPVARLARAIRLSPAEIERLGRVLLPPGRYGLGLVCSEGTAGLVLDVEKPGARPRARAARAGSGRWSAREAEVGAGGASELALELVERHGCGIGVALRLPDVAALASGHLAFAGFLRARGASWDVATRSGLEGLVSLLPRLVPLTGLERDLEECNVSVESVVALVGDYLRNAAAYAREKGIPLRLKLGRDAIPLTWDAEGLAARPRGNARPGESGEAGEDPIELDVGIVRRAIEGAASDPLAGVRAFVPRDVMDRAGYATAAALLECAEPRGRLLVWGGPHRFFDRSWEGDACAVFIDERGRATVAEFPSTPLAVDGEGERIAFEGGGLRLDLGFDELASRADVHGLGRHVAGTRLQAWLPGLEVVRSRGRFVSGRAELGGLALAPVSGWIYLERGEGPLLRWPFGATWHYVSFLTPDGECGSGVSAAPMLGASTPAWWARLTSESVDGAAVLPADAARPSGIDAFLPAFEPAGEPGAAGARTVRDAAVIGTGDAARRLAYSVVSAVVAPFDEDGHVIFRLRCLCGEGMGLVELPASVASARVGASRCDVVFAEGGMSFRANALPAGEASRARAGREMLRVETGGRSFLGPHEAPRAGLLARILLWLRRILGR